MGYKKYTFSEPVYDFAWHVQFGGDGEKAAEDFQSVAGPDTSTLSGKPTAAFVTADGYHGGLLYFKDKIPDANTIAHECLHAVMHLFRTIDTQFSEEPMAYYLGWLVGEVTSRCRRR